MGMCGVGRPLLSSLFCEYQSANTLSEVRHFPPKRSLAALSRLVNSPSASLVLVRSDLFYLAGYKGSFSSLTVRSNLLLNEIQTPSQIAVHSAVHRATASS